MKTVTNKPLAQGDILILPIEAIPSKAEEAQRGGRIVVAHSETGHDHAIDAMGCVRFEPQDPLVCYLRVDDAHADIVHHRAWDTHETVRLSGGGACYEIRRQREWSPEGWQRVTD